MRIRKIWTLKHLVIVAAALLMLGAASGIAYASIPASNGTINGCYKTSNPGQGALIVIDSTATCPSGTTSLNWSQTGQTDTFYFVKGLTFTVVPNGGSAAAVSCHTGDTVIGGGADNSDTTSGEMFMQQSFPTADNRWEVEMWNNDPVNSFTFSVYAECVHQG